jgi:hypothetical protein
MSLASNFVVTVEIPRDCFDFARELSFADNIEGGPRMAIIAMICREMERRPELVEIAVAVNRAAAKAREDERARLRAKSSIDPDHRPGEHDSRKETK